MSPLARAIRVAAIKNERRIRKLLQHWVSEIEPCVAYQDGEVIGLTVADAPVGSTPFILRLEDINAR